LVKRPWILLWVAAVTVAPATTDATQGAAAEAAMARPSAEAEPHHIRITDDAGAGGYEAFPDVTQLRNGDLFCVFYAGYGHVSPVSESWPKGGRICWTRSRDNGRTWSDPRVLVDTELDDRDPSVMQTSDGTLICNFFTYVPGEPALHIIRSHDNGETWEPKPQPLHPEPDTAFACSAPVLELPNGELILPLYFEHKAGLVRSTDGGTTWGDLRVIGAESDHNHDAEPHIIRLPDGRLFTTLRPCMCQSYSSDDGHTWTPPEPTGFEGHAPYHVVTRDGLLLCAHRLPDTALHISTDWGATWEGPFVIDNVIGSYPSMVELPDGTIFCVYYEEGAGSSIRATWFRARPEGIDFVEP